MKDVAEKDVEQKDVPKNAASGGEDLDRLVTVIVPRDDSEKKSKTMRLTLNRKSIVIPRGTPVEVPYKYKLLLEKKAKIRQLDDDYKDELERALNEQP
jgi:hypothetical protein